MEFYANSINSFKPCIIKQITGLPCPSCGVTRSVLLIVNKSYFSAFMLNPMGYIVVIGMIVLPIWFAYDILFKRESFYFFYVKFEEFIGRRKILFVILFLVAINWIWNIVKHI